MKKYVSLDKRSKKAKKEYYAGFRCTWDGMNPVTRTMPNGKTYNRKRIRKNCERSTVYRKGICSRSFCEMMIFRMQVGLQDDSAAIPANPSLTSVSSLIK